MTVTVCAHDEVDPDRFVRAVLGIFRYGLPIEAEIRHLSDTLDNCAEISLPECTFDTVIVATLDRTHEGRTRCTTEQAPIMIAMKFNRLEVLTSFFGFDSGERLSGFDLQAFVDDMSLAESIVITQQPDSHATVAALYQALQNENYPEAQLRAAELASTMRELGETRFSLPFSSITHVSGLRALGLDPLAPENPLVVTDFRTMSVALSESGRRVLSFYQEENDLRSPIGLWDYGTAITVSRIEPPPFGQTPRLLTVPRTFSRDDFIITRSGRFLLP